MKKLKIFLLIIGLIYLLAICGAALYFMAYPTQDPGGIHENRQYMDSISYSAGNL